MLNVEGIKGSVGKFFELPESKQRVFCDMVNSIINDQVINKPFGALTGPKMVANVLQNTGNNIGGNGR